MSQALENLELEKITALKDELTAVKYNDLKKVLTEKGLDKAWSAGEKKEVIILKAIQIFTGVDIKPVEEKKEEIKPEVPAEVKEELKEPKIETIVEEEKDEIETEVEEVEEIEDEEVNEIEEEIAKPVVKKEPVKEVEKVVLKEDDPRNFVSALTENISTEDLEINLERTTRLMKIAPDFQKHILVKKREQIEAELKKRLGK